MNGRLSCVARVMGLINPHQCGSLAGLSVADAWITLSHEVRTLQMEKGKVSTLILDIKGGFDNVNPSALLGILSAKGVNPYLASWTCFFLTGRSCYLLFQGSSKVFSPVSVGTPQDSPVSPLLFVIDVSRLHIEIPYGLTLSYVDDFALTALSASYLRNIQILQRHYDLVNARGARLGVSFSIPKTELSDWRTNRDRNPPSHALIHVDGSIFRPQNELRCLGYWFTPSLLGARTLVRIYRAELPYLDTHQLRRKTITPPSSPCVGTARHHWPPGSCVPTPRTTVNGTHVITPYTSRPSVRPDPVRRIYGERPSKTLCKWKQVNRMTAHRVTDTRRQTVGRVGRK